MSEQNGRDSLVDEVRQIRAKLAEEADHDVQKLIEAARAYQEMHQGRVVSIDELRRRGDARRATS